MPGLFAFWSLRNLMCQLLRRSLLTNMTTWLSTVCWSLARDSALIFSISSKQ
jgi:hypothetical protein